MSIIAMAVSYTHLDVYKRQLYNGIGEETVALMRELIATADFIVPNYTEATYLAGVPYQCGGTTREELYALADKLHTLGTESVLITSARMLVDGGWEPIACVVGYDAAALLPENTMHL